MPNEINARTTAQDVGAWDNSFPPRKPFRRPGMVERGSLGVEFHVPWVDAGPVSPISLGSSRSIVPVQLPEHPWIIQVVFTAFNQEDCKISVEVCQAACHNTSC